MGDDSDLAPMVAAVSFVEGAGAVIDAGASVDGAHAAATITTASISIRRMAAEAYTEAIAARRRSSLEIACG